MENSPVKAITDSVERIFRYLVPGFTFSIFFALSYPEHFESVLSILKSFESQLLLFIMILGIGMSIYSLESLIIRITLKPLVYLFNISPVNVFSGNRRLSDYSKAHAEHILSQIKWTDYPRDYYHYLWSLIHYSLIASSLIIYFSWQHSKNSWVECSALSIRLFGFSTLILSLFSYCCMQLLEKDTSLKLKSYQVNK